MENNEKAEVTLEEKIDKALLILLEQVRVNLKPAETLQQTQAVLNMAHARHLLLASPPVSEGKTLKKTGAGA